MAATTVHVIATSLEGTRQALEAAAGLAGGIHGRIVLFLRRRSAELNVAGNTIVRDEGEQALRRLADSYVPRASVLSCVCERAIDVVQLFQSPGLIVIGGGARTWWPTAEQRLANALTRLGYQVTFVPVPLPRAGIHTLLR